MILTGERPEVNPEVAARLHQWGHDDFTSYVIWACERALERGILPHTNIGVLGRDELARLREVTASQGLMLESTSERLMQTVHAGSPTKHPAQRLATIEAAGQLRIPFTSGILVGIGESEEERIAALEALAELQRSVRAPAGGDPAELRPPPPLLRTRGGRDRRGRGAQPLGRRRPPPGSVARGSDGDGSATADRTEARRGVDHVRRRCRRGHRRSASSEIKRLISECARLMPGVGSRSRQTSQRAGLS